MSFTDDVRAAAADYLKRGWCPLPLKPKDKAPAVERNWPQFKTSLETLEADFHPHENIGIILGKRSGGLIDVDLDCQEANNVADVLAPKTDLVSGRGGARRSHRWYVMNPVPPKIIQYEDVDGTMLVELRSTGGQTMVAPSIHPNGDKFEWEKFEEPGTGLTVAIVGRIAAAALLARH